jgi:hypothetical protein
MIIPCFPLEQSVKGKKGSDTYPVEREDRQVRTGRIRPNTEEEERSEECNKGGGVFVEKTRRVCLCDPSAQCPCAIKGCADREGAPCAFPSNDAFLSWDETNGLFLSLFFALAIVHSHPVLHPHSL